MFNGTVQHSLVLCGKIDYIVQESKNKTDDSIDKENEGNHGRRERSIGITLIFHIVVFVENLI